MAGESTLVLLFVFVVKFRTLIKKDGEASVVRSSNESVFISSGGASIGGRLSPSCSEPTAEPGHGSHLTMSDIPIVTSENNPLLCPTVAPP